MRCSNKPLSTIAERRPCLRLPFYLLLSAFVLLFASGFTSPLYPYYYGEATDSTIFMLVGKGIVYGKTAYADIFENKGIVLFLIEALGWLIARRTGVWLMQCLFAGFTLWLLDLSLRRMGCRRQLVPLLLGAVIFLYTFTRGNLSLSDVIPEEDRTSVLSYGVSAEFYLVADIFHCYKYYNPHLWSVIDERVMDDYFDYLSATPPKWLLVDPSHMDATISAFLASRYTLVEDSTFAACYRLIGTNGGTP